MQSKINSILKFLNFYTVFSILLIVSASWFFYFQMFNSWYEPDEAVFLLGGSLMNRGFSLYKDFVDNKPPLVFLLAYFVEILSLNFVQLKILLLIISLAVFFLLYKILQKINVSKKDLLLSFLFSLFMISFPYFAFLSLRLEQLLIYFLVISLYFYFEKSKILLSSFFISLFPFLKPSYMLFWLIFFYLDKRLIIPVLSFFILLLASFLVFFGEEMLYSVIYISLLKGNTFYNDSSFILQYKASFLILSFFLVYFLLIYFILKKELYGNKLLRFFYLFSLIYLIGSFTGLFSFGFYLQILSPFILFSSPLFCLSFIQFVRKSNAGYSVKKAFTFILFIVLLLSLYLFISSQIFALYIKNARTSYCVGCLTKEDAKVLFSLKSSGKNILIASRDSSIYYPYFIELSPKSILPTKVESKDGLFPCFTGCLKVLPGEYEYFIYQLKRENLAEYDAVIFDKIGNKDGSCLASGMFCFSKNDEELIKKNLYANNYSLTYSGDAVFVYSKN